jgi:predicted ester cyclase
VRFQDGMAVERWAVGDEMGMMRQLGLVPEPGA